MQPGFLPYESIQYRQDKGRRFAGARLRQPHCIAPLHNRRDCLDLNRSRGNIPRRFDPGRNRGVKIEFFKVQ